MGTQRFFKMVLVAAVASAIPAYGDLFQLKDGRVLSGTMARDGGGDAVIHTEDGSTVTVKPGEVVRTTLTSRLTPDEAANSEWTRDAALIKQANDLPTIIALHEQFLKKYPDQAIAATVRKSQAEYEKLMKQDGVKFRGRWMPAAQVDVTLRQWAAKAAPAMTLYKSGQLRAALVEARRVIDADASNPNALEVAGLAAYRLNNLNGAADYFAALVEADPADVLAENNLGVILFSNGRQAESLGHYTRALQAAPTQRLVADNVLEALAAFTGSVDAPVYQNLVRQFNQSEGRIEAEMATTAGGGLYRYGATWVPAAEAARLNGNLQAIKTAMARLDSAYQGQQQDGGTIAEQLKQATDDYNNTLASIQYLNSAMLNGTGGSDVVARRQALLSDLERERQQKAALEAQRDALVTGSPDLFTEAARLKVALAEAKRIGYTGVQRIMDVGEAENPPAPVVIAMPPPFVSQPVVVQVVPVVPAPAPQTPAVAYNDPYQQVYGGGEGFVPLIVLPQRGGEGLHDGMRGDGHRGVITGTPIVPARGPVAPVGPRSPSLDGSTNGGNRG
jgi:tetratricopeptide (TPR) repeat protein